MPVTCAETSVSSKRRSASANEAGRHAWPFSTGPLPRSPLASSEAVNGSVSSAVPPAFADHGSDSELIGHRPEPGASG